MDNNMIFDKECYTISIDPDTGCIRKLYDKKEMKGINLVNPDKLFGSLTYTLYDKQSYDICVSGPYGGKEHIVINDSDAIHKVISVSDDVVICRNAELNSILTYEFFDGSFIISLDLENENTSQLGINTDFNFLATPGYLYEGQILPSSPYTSQNGEFMYYLMTRPNGRWVLLTSISPLDGWKLEYSKHNAGHFIVGMKMLESFDKVFKERKNTRKHRMSIKVEFPESYRDAMNRLHNTLKVPIPVYRVSGGVIGTKIPVEIIGEPKKVYLYTPSNLQMDITGIMLNVSGKTYVSIDLKEEGLHRVEVSGDNGKVMDCLMYAFPGWMEMFEKSCRTIKKPYHCDDQLCEGGVWSWTLCLYTRLLGERYVFNEKIKEYLDGWVLPGYDGTPVQSVSIVPYPHEFEGRTYKPYHIYKSARIQEQFFGVSILLEAFRAYNNRTYLEYACRAMMNILEEHISPEGAIICDLEGFKNIDYTTVCAPVIAVVDLANALNELHDPRGLIFAAAAEKIADFLVRRGLNFPTEGDFNYTAAEMEDGSISCTALSVIYVCFYLKYKPEYVRFAAETLKLHDAWTIYSPDARMFRSTFRWWETIWEGDRDGACFNAGHAWTLWRGEAEFYYALLTGDMERFIDSYNAYMTNLCKIQPDGTSYSCYIPDYIPQRTSVGTLVHRYPLTPDQSLSRYIWPRSVDSWFKAGGIHSEDGMVYPINGSITLCGDVMEFKSAAPDFKYFMIGDIEGVIRLTTDNTTALISKGNRLDVRKGFIEYTDGLWNYTTPDRGVIEIKICSI